MRILVVEDHDEVARFVVKGLQEEHYAVDRAATGTEGVSMARVNDYDVIILDVMLPGMNGIDVATTLRGKGLQVPILMLTAKSQTGDKVQGLDAGADDYLTKPFAFAELLARIRALLRRRDNSSPAPLQIADLVLDLVSHSVNRAEQAIELTNREYGLLEFLMRNKGRVLTRTTITEHVWDMHFDSDTNVVDVFIRHLRAKLDDGFSPKLIHTVRGVGYVLREE
ncbi:MAG: response regulator transcription factor [Lentisphaerae bacterium]|jgi:two-component system, OmpR family, copper resistance phosphate regulon response regulator CusR|nr:response regulator transcription factor [Lentisphaerota bacterium]